MNIENVSRIYGVYEYSLNRIIRGYFGSEALDSQSGYHSQYTIGLERGLGRHTLDTLLELDYVYVLALARWCSYCLIMPSKGIASSNLPIISNGYPTRPGLRNGPILI